MFELIVLVLFLLACVKLFPKIIKERNEKARKESLIQALPDFIDLIALSMLAGSSFDAALELYVKHYKTNLAVEIESRLILWKSGIITRAEGLYEIAKAVDIPAFDRFVTQAIDSFEMGTPLAHTLLNESREVRKEARDHELEQIEKAPVKMLIPVTTLILPAMLLAILGPLFAALTVQIY